MTARFVTGITTKQCINHAEHTWMGQPSTETSKSKGHHALPFPPHARIHRPERAPDTNWKHHKEPSQIPGERESPLCTRIRARLIRSYFSKGKTEYKSKHIYDMAFSYVQKNGDSRANANSYTGDYYDSTENGDGIRKADMMWIHKYGKIFGTFDGRQPNLLVADQELLKELFVKKFHFFPDRQVFEGANGDMEESILNLKGEHWKNVRSLMTPAFTSGKLKKMSPMINKAGNSLVEQMSEKIKSESVLDMKRFYGGFTMDVIASTAFGIDVSSNKNQDDPFVKNAADFLNMSFSSPAILMMSKSGLTFKEILGNCMIFFLAGYETTASSLCFMTFEVARRQEIQERLYQEVKDVLGDEEPDFENIGKLTYLDLCVNETLRMYPPVLRLDRACVQDAELGGYKIPKGTFLTVPIYAIHHDPVLWENPDEYNPDRFLPENRKSHAQYQFIPFGSGPRNCIGMRLGLLEFKMAFVHVIRKFQFSHSEKTKILDDIDLNASDVLSPKELWLNVKRR
ncbi:hypothetical protein FSP39_023273 [Pinctada imbricata]|uniref:Cytochrome P450 n=1 Tax=Pinctada imbricata TaxID=66713 RepID=A0AA88YLW2_PINIB|nr:hypothetical protein FSP39_023273 [Pinctada imbricata]